MYEGKDRRGKVRIQLFARKGVRKGRNVACTMERTSIQMTKGVQRQLACPLLVFGKKEKSNSERQGKNFSDLEGIRGLSSNMRLKSWRNGRRNILREIAVLNPKKKNIIQKRTENKERHWTG